MEYHLSNYEKHRKSNDLVMASFEDGEFHKSIYQASGNDLLYELISSIHKELYVLWETPYNKGTLYDESFPFHVELLDSMKQQDKKKAITAFYALIDSVKQNILKIEKL